MTSMCKIITLADLAPTAFVSFTVSNLAPPQYGLMRAIIELRFIAFLLELQPPGEMGPL